MGTEFQFPWNDLLPETQGEVVTHLDPYVKQSLSMTCKACYKRWNNPKYYMKSLIYLVRYAPVERIEEYIEHPLWWTYSDPWPTILMYGVENVFSPMKFLEMAASKIRELSERRQKRLFNSMARGICSRGNIEMYDWIRLQTTRHEWSIQDEDLFENQNGLACVISFGNVELADALLTKFLIPPMTNRQFLCCVLLSDVKSWRNSIDILRFYKRFGSEPLGSQLLLVLRELTAIPDNATWKLNQNARLEHLHDLWPHVDNDTRNEIRANIQITFHLFLCADMYYDRDAYVILEDMGWDLSSASARMSFERLAFLLSKTQEPQNVLRFINRGTFQVHFRDLGDLRESIIAFYQKSLTHPWLHNLNAVRNWISLHPFPRSDLVIAIIDGVREGVFYHELV